MDTDTSHEARIKAAIKQVKPEKTAPDFVAQVMHKIKASEHTVYTPLVSQKGWLGIALATVTIILGVFYFGNDMILPELFDVKKISSYTLPNISDNIHLSKNMIYGIFFTSVMLLLQLPIIKSRYHRRM